MAKTFFNAFNQHMLNHSGTNAFGLLNVAHYFAVTIIQTKYYTHFFFVPADDFKAIRAPARVGMQSKDFTVMSTVITNATCKAWVVTTYPSA
ncbi:hypothetical protein A10D4_00510 [Idiomarina xiamenensis 10-D-4]|uniref:Uncharacterized protein n=1 Tax=Idiomarina xiamenensis 10-D-4 TaxID=740709 RepID=K2LCD8_9GAMM|nr:hypothetical protein [Idiomarina xiamenensis]EKE87530.1 hypothetical protein A10D4_00510 [Idiomarina xiamenensis 10-D-4]